MMNSLFVFMATLLFVATTLVSAMPIPESFKRVEKREYDHEAWVREATSSQAAVAAQQAADNEKWQAAAIASQNAVAEAQASAYYAQVAALENGGGHAAHGKSPEPVQKKHEKTKDNHRKHTTTEAPKPTTTTTQKKVKPTTTQKKAEPTTTQKKAKPTTTQKKAKPTTTQKKAKPTTTTTTTTTTQKPTPKPTPKPKPTTTTTKKAEPTQGGGGGGSFPFSGDGTWYNTGLGSCGITNSDSDFIAAMNYGQMENGANPNNNPNCGRKVNIKGPKGTVTVEVTDTCPTCAYGSIDLSPAAFMEIASLDDGRVTIDWDWA